MSLSYNNKKVFLLKRYSSEAMISIYLMEADSGLTLRMDVPTQKVPLTFLSQDEKIKEQALSILLASESAYYVTL